MESIPIPVIGRFNEGIIAPVAGLRSTLFNNRPVFHKDSLISRILMLVPQEPDEDPRIHWVIQLCAGIARTDVVGFTSGVNAKPTRSYDGAIFIDRVNYADYMLIKRQSILWRVLRCVMRRSQGSSSVGFPILFLKCPRTLGGPLSNHRRSGRAFVWRSKYSA